MDFEKYNKAFEFATIRHAKQLRKGSKIPYIVHIYEVAQYLKEEGTDEDTLIAGILHDTVEDTDTSLEEIEKLFGRDVAALVGDESEDKSLPYLERKRLHMAHLKASSERAKLVNCADKLSNLRAIYLDIKTFGNDVWKRFNGSKEEIKIYYSLALDALSSLEGRKIYKDLQYYFNKVFNEVK